MIIYNLKNDDKDEQVIEEIPCKQEVITTKKPYKNGECNIYYNDCLYSITQGFSEENLKYIVEALNKAYQNGFSEGATMMMNK